MQILEKYLSFDFFYPAAQAPTWATRVERWYQLDSPSYGLCEFYEKKLRDEQKPGILFLASAEGSLPTDVSFAQSGASSPAKFVHTLPSVRASSLCQVMEWYGQILCVQNGQASFEKAVHEARNFLRRAGSSSAWVLSHQSMNGQNRIVAQICHVAPSVLHNET